MTKADQTINNLLIDIKTDKTHGKWKMLILRMLIDLCPDCREKVSKIFEEIVGDKNDERK